MLKSRLSIFHQYCSNGYLFFFSFFKKWVRSVYSGKKIFYGLKKRLKVLIFFFYRNVKKIKLKLRAWRQEKGTVKSTVDGEYNVRQF